jgi:G:T/U-mismatch repair DNA glycosylase
MLPEIWEPNLKAVFVGSAIIEPSDKLGFYYLHPRDRFWELLELGGITPNQMITKQERKALDEGQAKGNLSDPVRVMFLQKRTSQLLKLGIGITHLNRRMVAESEKDKNARPSREDVQEFITKAESLKPKILAFVTDPENFLSAFSEFFPQVTPSVGLQPFTISTIPVWLMGSTTGKPRAEALAKQEDLFFELGEAVSALSG